MGALIAVIVVAVILVSLVMVVWSTYNGLVRARIRVKEAWSGIDVQLKRRSSLIPNLVETVKGYAAHEKEVFENVAAARAGLMNAQGPAASAQVGVVARLRWLPLNQETLSPLLRVQRRLSEVRPGFRSVLPG